jgi:hypothetical protein
VEVARDRWAGCEIAIVHQPAAVDEASALGLPIAFDAASRFRVDAWLVSATRPALSAWRPDVVIVQMPDGDATGSQELGCIALLAGGGEFWIVTPDGSLHQWRTTEWIGRLLRPGLRRVRNAVLVTAAAVLAALTTPGWLAGRACWALRDRGLLGRGRL